MDPNENVREQNAIRICAQRAQRDGNAPCDIDAERLADLDDALTAWLAHGGFAPTERLLTLAEIQRLLAEEQADGEQDQDLFPPGA